MDGFFRARLFTMDQRFELFVACAAIWAGTAMGILCFVLAVLCVLMTHCEGYL